MYNVILQTPEGKTLPQVFTALNFSEWVMQSLKRFSHLCFPYLTLEQVEKDTGTKLNRWNEEICLPYVIEHIEDFLMSNLHGSGWDGKWEVEKTNTGFIATMQYHCMNENGYYDGWVDINVFLDEWLEVKRVTFPGASSYYRRNYIWDGYHGDCIHEVFRNLQKQIVEDCLIQLEKV